MADCEIVRIPAPVTDWRKAIALQSGAELLINAAPFETMESNLFDLVQGLAEETEHAVSPLGPLFAFVVIWSLAGGYGLPKATPAADKFIRRAAKDPIRNWRRYKLSSEVEKELIAVCREHVETHTEKKWNGIRML